MTDRYRQQWEALGQIDPYWAVMSDSIKKGGRWEQDEFFATGSEEIRAVLVRTRALGFEPRRGLALDYGCGVGRLSRALATSFFQVIGVDFSESMLSEARRANVGIGNLRLEHNDGWSLPAILPASVDFIYSVLTLQHSPAKIQCAIIREFSRVAAPGAVVVFQTPSRPILGRASGMAFQIFGNRVLNVVRRTIHGHGRVMEIHTLSRRLILQLLADCCFEVIEVERYDVAGPSFESYRYFAVRR
jgi:SAM-dependent methyltransferase